MMKMKNTVAIVAICMASLLILTGTFITFAWFSNLLNVDIDEGGGSVLTQYFHSGTGTQDDPYVITRPMHYYNLAMLYQANPQFNDSNFIDSALNFRIGSKDLDHDGVDELTDFSVFNYADDGSTDGTPSDTLNLASYADGLLSIGTANKPFQAEFDGSDITLSNMKIIGTTELNGITYKTPDIGMFGYVSVDAKIHDIFIDNLTIDLTNVDEAAEYQSVDPNLSSQHHAHTGTVYVGYIAGHIMTGAQVNDVYVNNCSITGGRAATNGFGYFGHVEDPSGTAITTLGSEIVTLRTKGDNAGFGGSLDMRNMLERLQGVWNYAAQPANYNATETIVFDEVNNTKTVETGNPQAITYAYADYQYKYYQSDYAGKYYFFQRDDMDGYQFMQMYGESSLTPKTVTTYVEKNNYLNAFYIQNGQTYLSVEGTAVADAAAPENAAKWLFDAQNHLYTYIGRDIYYLNNSGLNGVALSASPVTVWGRGGDNELFATIDSKNYYLDYQLGWILTFVHEYYYLSDGNGNYLSLNGSEIVNVTSENASVKWQADISGTSYSFYTVVGDTLYYLSCDGTLSVSTASSAWTFENNALSKEISGVRHVLIFDTAQSRWIAVPASGKRISDGSGHYLSATSSGVMNGSATDSLIWQFSSDTGTTTIYSIINGAQYYLIYNNGLKVSQVPANWNRSGDLLYCTVASTDFYLKYNNGWDAFPLQYCLIGDGQGNYLRATGENAFANTTARADATHFFFSNSGSAPAGTIRYLINGVAYNLGNNAASFSNTATDWVNENGRLRSGSSSYYLVYNSGTWRIADCALYYTISDASGHYLNANSSYDGLSVGTASNATLWTFSNTTNESTPSGIISVMNGSSPRYLRINASTVCGNTTYSLQLSATATNNSWNNNGSTLQNASQTSHYLSYSSNAWTQASTGTALTITKQQITPTTLGIELQTEAQPTLVTEEVSNEAMAVSIIGSFTTNHPLVFSETTQQEIVKNVASNVRGGYQTYFPLRIATSDETDWYDANDPYRVSNKNTGYIISGARIQETNTTDQQKGAGDIRISYFPISSINLSYNTTNKAFTNLYTIDGNGNHVLTDAQKESAVYKNASAQLLEALDGSASVYGLHFMDAQISKDYLLTADKALILGKPYEQYEMPLDSINFRTVERGTISFFAGSYFTDNNTFFSLHQVFRNENDKITDIKEISEIYQHTTLGIRKPYIYRFSDGTYSNADGKYTGATTLAADYTSAFNTAWITNPTGMTEENKIYYFEIPCNKGEFCLGSVSGKTGAYLIYLDIATNGGDVISKVISAEGNEIINGFKVAYRDSPDSLAEGEYSDLLFTATAPGGTDSSKFSVSVNFDKTAAEPDFQGGVYTITVLNKSDSDVKLDVYLCDNDRDATNDFPYAYRVLYTNLDHTDQLILTATQANQWQSMASFIIPDSGPAEEAAYSIANE